MHQENARTTPATMNPPTLPPHELIYHIDAADRLCGVNADWGRFALANNGTTVMPDQVLGRSLWDFIEDNAVRELYRQIIQRARSGHPAHFNYRCDAPDFRRQFRMTIRAAADSTVEFTSRLCWEHQRPRVNLIDLKTKRNKHWVRVCGWCQNIALPDGTWMVVEEAVRQLGLMAKETPPILTHGICPPCHSAMMAQMTPTSALLDSPQTQPVPWSAPPIPASLETKRLPATPHDQDCDTRFRI